MGESKQKLQLSFDEGGATAPEDMETRAEFLARLGRQVHWLNDVMHDHLLELCTNQKERGLEIEELLGTKCKW